MQRRSLTFVAISVLVIALMYSSLSAFYVFAAPPAPGFLSKSNCSYGSGREAGEGKEVCCWKETATGQFGIIFCQTCYFEFIGTYYDCSDVSPHYPPYIEQPPTPPSSGPGAPLGSIPEGGGVLPELEQTPPSPSPEEIAPTIDCAQNPDDPLCETATIPEGEIEEQQPGEGSGGGDSSDGGNNPDGG